MKDYVIVTDGTADLPAGLLDELQVETVPMEFLMDGESYHHYPDAREMSLDEFYRKLKAGAKVSTTQINSYTYETFFEPILERGQDILYICFSSGLSGSYQNSRIAAEGLMEKYPGRKILCVDSLCASAGEGFLVYRAGLLRKEGMGLEELAAWTEENRLRVAHWFVVDDLDHLRQGGRISAAQAILGTALNVKPLLYVDQEGKLQTAAKIRGIKKVLDTFCKKLENDAEDPGEQTVLVGHAGNPEMAEKLKGLLLEKGLVKDVIIAEIGPIIGTHVGAGMFAVIFMNKPGVER